MQVLPSNISDSFALQARACAALGSPFTAILCDAIARYGMPDGSVFTRLSQWEGNTSGTGAALALRVMGALHWLVLTGRDKGLASAYPPNEIALARLEGSTILKSKFLVNDIDLPL